MRLTCFLPLALAATSWAQDTSVGTPALGFAFDAEAQVIRAIRGIPGAALVEDPIDAGFPILSAAISTRQNFALVTAGDSSVHLLRFGHGAALLEGAIPSPGRVVLSAGGHAALLYGSGRLQTVSGLPERPGVRDWNLPSFSEAPAAFGVSDNAELVVLAAGGDDSAPVWLLSSHGSPSQLSLPGSIRAVAFHRSRPDLVALTAAGDLYLIRDAGSNAPYRVFPAAGTPGGTAVQFSTDGARAYAADADGSLSAVDLENGAATRVSCGCRARALEPLNGENVFRITDLAELPVMLFDASKLEPRFWFVPRGHVRRLEGGLQ